MPIETDWQRVWVGSTGPFPFDQKREIMDYGGNLAAGVTERALTTTGQLRVEEEPDEQYEVTRLEEIAKRLMEPVEVSTLEDPSTELNALDPHPVSEGYDDGDGVLLLAYEVNDIGNISGFTLYGYDSNDGGSAENVPWTVDADTAPGIWVALAGKYQYNDHVIFGHLKVRSETNIANLRGLDIYQWAQNVYVKQRTTDKDIVFHVADGGVDREVARFDGDERAFRVATGAELNLQQCTAERLCYTNTDKNVRSTDLDDWVDGTAPITITDDGDGTITISCSYAGGGSDTDFTVVTAIQAGGAGAVGFQYKTRDLTLDDGRITTVGAESGWNDV